MEPTAPAPHVLAGSYAETHESAAMKTIRAGVVELLNDRGITARARLRPLGKLTDEVEGFTFDRRSRLPEPRSRRGDPPRI